MEIPGYTIIRELGSGGMATVYLARQDRLTREVALKVMKPIAMTGGDFTARFVKEGQIIAQLHHPQIVTIYDFNTHEGYYYFSMEYLPGGTLADEIKKGLAISRTIALTQKIAAALAVAHEQGLIHRDVKPQNILFRSDGNPVLTDFGIARSVKRGPESMQLTTYGMVVGSPRYMSPEQSTGQMLDVRADLYSIGVVFYEMLTNHLPYEADDVVSLALKHCTAPIPKLPEHLAQYQSVLDRLIAKKPEERFANAAQLIQALNAFEGSATTTTTIPEETTRIMVRTVVPALTTLEPQEIKKYDRRLIKFGLFTSLGILIIGISGYIFWINRNDNSTQVTILLPPETPNRTPSAIQYEKLALDHFKKGQYAQSLEIVRLGLTLTPDDARLIALQARLQDQIQAEEQLQEAQVLINQNQLDAALNLVETSLRQAPTHPGLLVLRGEIATKLAANKNQRAEELLQQATAQYTAGDLVEAARKIQEGLALVPAHSKLLQLQALMQRAQQQTPQITDQLQRAREQLAAGAIQTSLDIIEKALALAPHNAQLLELKATAQKQLQRDNQKQLADLIDQIQTKRQAGDLKSALALIESGLKQNPQNAELQALQAEITSPTGVSAAENSKLEHLTPPSMVKITGGCFQMGSPANETGREEDERLHQVCVKDFRLAPVEISVADFKKFVDATNYRTDAEQGSGGADGCWALDQDNKTDPWRYWGWANWQNPNKYRRNQDNDPVSCVSWNDAQAYVQWLNRGTEGGFRLPTEAEWEYAARAGTTSARFWGKTADKQACRYANSADAGHGWANGFPCNDHQEWVAPIGNFLPNAWGLKDMLGNLSEWTCSEYNAAFDGSESTCVSNASNAPRTLRGGSWYSGPSKVRAAYRDRNFPESRYNFIGFRLAQDILSISESH